MSGRFSTHLLLSILVFVGALSLRNEQSVIKTKFGIAGCHSIEGAEQQNIPPVLFDNQNFDEQDENEDDEQEDNFCPSSGILPSEFLKRHLLPVSSALPAAVDALVFRNFLPSYICYCCLKFCQ